MKSLKVIQVLSKIAQIVSKVVFICCIVGFCGCVCGIISLAMGVYALKFDGKSLEVILLETQNISLNTLYAKITACIFLCAGEAVIAKFAEVYFGNELKAGTPFTFEGSKELMRLGIIEICVSLGALILAAITYAIFLAAAKDVAPMGKEFGNYSAVSTGLLFIILSVIFKYGAELRMQNSAEKEPVIENEKSEPVTEK